MLEKMYDEVAAGYDEKYSAEEYRLEDKELFEAIGKFAVGKVLDIGCGTGNYLDYMEPEDFIGIDPSAGMLEVARRKHPDAHFVQTTFEDFDTDEEFDTIVSLFSSASYISPEHYTRFADLLADGGHYYIMVYRPDYTPDYYVDNPDISEQVHGNIDYDRLAQVEGCTLYTDGKYVIATNTEQELELFEGV